MFDCAIVPSTKGQFHQHFMSSFFQAQIPKVQKYITDGSLFVLLGSVRVNAARKMLVKSTQTEKLMTSRDSITLVLKAQN